MYKKKIARMPEEISYHHYSLTFDPSEISHRFKDVRFVLVAGCLQRAEAQGSYLAEKLFDGINLPSYQLEQLTKSLSRFALFKIGPVLLSNHGMGCASMSIALHELFLMCQQANVLDLITVLRFGTCKYTQSEVYCLKIITQKHKSLTPFVLYKSSRWRHRCSCWNDMYYR